MGQYNTAAGAYSLQLDTCGFRNTVFGWNAMTAITTGRKKNYTLQNTANG